MLYSSDCKENDLEGVFQTNLLVISMTSQGELWLQKWPNGLTLLTHSIKMFSGRCVLSHTQARNSLGPQKGQSWRQRIWINQLQSHPIFQEFPSTIDLLVTSLELTTLVQRPVHLVVPSRVHCPLSRRYKTIMLWPFLQTSLWCEDPQVHGSLIKTLIFSCE
jgi:hypothetical protein